MIVISKATTKSTNVNLQSVKNEPAPKEQAMKRFTIEPLSQEVLEKSGWNKRWSKLNLK